MEQMVSLISLGDGSTLTLDFTTGVLDSRLTFTRASDATFINSQGFVQYAAVNYFSNTGWTSGTTPTGWNVTFGTGTTTWNADGTLTMTAGGSAVRPCINATSFSVAQGIPFTFGFRVTAVSGSPTIDQVISSTVAGETFSRNGATVSGSTVVQNGDIISCTFTPTTTSNAARMGPGVNVGVTNISITITQPQFNPGTTLQPYYANTSTIAARWDSARFDHDPTTRAPRGLLIEGSATNLARRSDDFNTTVVDGTSWTASGYTAGTLSTTLPDGTTGNARRISIASGSGSFRSADITVTASTAYTFSFWARNNGGSQARFRVWNITAGSSIVDYTQSVNNYVSQIGGANNTSSTWVRVSVQFTTPVGCTSIWVYPSSSDSGTVDLLVWGAQVEAGSVSSYIPTGASTGSRAADSCVMTGSNFSSWFNATEGTLLAHAIRSRTSDIGRIASVNDNTANESIELGADTTGEFIVVDGGSTLATISPGTVTANTAFKIAGAYKLNDVQAALGGTLGTADTSVTLPTVNRLMIGQQAGGSPVYLNGTISLLKYWPTRLTNAQLQSLTT
jgi:hypothetical protein